MKKATTTNRMVPTTEMPTARPMVTAATGSAAAASLALGDRDAT
jgi:hypothetical protein